MTNFSFGGVKRRTLNGAITFFNNFCHKNWSLGNGGQLKTRLLQCYVILWIHNIDAICSSPAFCCFKKFHYFSALKNWSVLFLIFSKMQCFTAYFVSTAYWSFCSYCWRKYFKNLEILFTLADHKLTNGILCHFWKKVLVVK